MNAQAPYKPGRAIQLTHIWIDDLDRQLGWNDKPRSYRLLKAVLHALRDSLEVEEAVDLASRLPTPLRELFCEQWLPTAKVSRPSIETFLEQINCFFRPDPLSDTAKAIMAVFQLLTSKVVEGESENVKQHPLPKTMRDARRGSQGGTRH
jgi:uncharacterized protein (DUF2267 family)